MCLSRRDGQHEQESPLAIQPSQCTQSLSWPAGCATSQILELNPGQCLPQLLVVKEAHPTLPLNCCQRARMSVFSLGQVSIGVLGAVAAVPYFSCDYPSQKLRTGGGYCLRQCCDQQTAESFPPGWLVQSSLGRTPAGFLLRRCQLIAGLPRTASWSLAGGTWPSLPFPASGLSPCTP